MAFIFVALPAIGEGLAGLFTAGTAAGGVGSATGAAAGSAAGALGGAGGAGAGLTLGQVGSGLGAASSGLNLAGKLFGSGQQGPVGRVSNVGGAGEPGNVSPYVIDPRSTTAATSVPSPFGGYAPNTFIQQGQQDFYSQGQDQQGGQQVQHFWGGGMADGSDMDIFSDWGPTQTSYMDTYLANDKGVQDLITSQSPYSVIDASSVRNSLQDSQDKSSSIWDWFKKTNPKTGEVGYDWGKIGLLGLGGMGIASLFSKPSLLPKYQQPTAQQYGLGARLASNYAPQRKFADGGIAALSPNPTFPMSQQQTSRYAVPNQMPVSANDVRMAHLSPVSMAEGGLGSYSDGGRMLRGPGDGMSDNIPATIGGKQPARLADGEFVVPADVVSHLGNGSTDAGAKQLYKMMDKVRTARTGRKAQGKQIKPSKYIPT